MRVLYLHGFASGPSSKKGVAFQEHLGARGIAVERLDLRVPSLEHLRLSQMIASVRAEVREGDYLIGSSLGGLTAARVAELEPRVRGVVLLAPAFQIAERWRETLGPAFDDWARTGWHSFVDYTTGKPARVDFEFWQDAHHTDIGYPSLTCPIVVLHGRGDAVVPIARSVEFCRRHAGSRLVELDDGHELVASLPILLEETVRFLPA